MPVVSIRSEKGVRYPAEGPFSPSTRFPEYPFSDCASVANPVYASVRDCLRDAGLDAKNYDSASWNPLGHFIQKGQRVFVLCNFVTHRRAQKSLEAFTAKCTHGSVLRAVVDYVLLAVGPEGSVTFGNAPLQS